MIRIGKSSTPALLQIGLTRSSFPMACITTRLNRISFQPFQRRLLGRSCLTTGKMLLSFQINKQQIRVNDIKVSETFYQKSVAVYSLVSEAPTTLCNVNATFRLFGTVHGVHSETSATAEILSHD